MPHDAPARACRSGLFGKCRRLPDGARVRTGYSYNTLVSRPALETLGPTFEAAFRYTGSSDHRYFKQAVAAVLRSVWSPNALAYEEIDPARVRLSGVFKRGYRIGTGRDALHPDWRCARHRPHRLARRGEPRLCALAGPCQRPPPLRLG